MAGASLGAWERPQNGGDALRGPPRAPHPNGTCRPSCSPSAGCGGHAYDPGILMLATPATGGAGERVQRARGHQLPRWLLIRTAAAFLGAGRSAFTPALLP